MTPDVASRRVGKAEENKRDKYERILAAARELFSTRGYERTTMEAIADRAGVAKGSVFFHARSKAALLNQVFQIDMVRWVDEAFEPPSARTCSRTSCSATPACRRRCAPSPT